MITSERLNTGRRNLAVMCIEQNSRLSLIVNVKGQRPRSPGQKNEKVRHFVRGRPLGRGPRAAFFCQWSSGRVKK